jgi:hypothetical protein
VTVKINRFRDRLTTPHSPVGDPWCIVYDQQHHRIILHVARIERQYVVVWPREQRSAKTAIMALAVDMALKGLKSQRRRVS